MNKKIQYFTGTITALTGLIVALSALFQATGDLDISFDHYSVRKIKSNLEENHYEMYFTYYNARHEEGCWYLDINSKEIVGDKIVIKAYCKGFDDTYIFKGDISKRTISGTWETSDALKLGNFSLTFQSGYSLGLGEFTTDDDPDSDAELVMKIVN